MEYNELEMLWKQYDKKLDNLEKFNKKLVKETLLQKPQKRLNHLEFRSLYSLIAVPVILIIALHPDLTSENIDWKFLLGCLLVLGVIVYLCIGNLKSYRILHSIDLDADTIIQSLTKIVKVKSIASGFQRNVLIYYPLIYSGCILIGWNSFTFTGNTISFLIALFFITYYANIWGVGKHKGKIEKLEKDVFELKEYLEE